MKKINIVLSVIFLSLVFNSCVKSVVKKKMVIAQAQFLKKSEYYNTLKLQQPHKINKPEKFILYNNYMLLQDVFSGIHILDVSNSSSPVNVGFIPAANARDFSVKNNMMYLDCNRDLVTLNLSNLQNIMVESIQPNVFISQNMHSNGDSTMVFSGYKYIDTVISNDGELYGYYYGKNFFEFSSFAGSGLVNSIGSGGGTSVGGSMARFTLVNNYLYAADNNALLSFNITNEKTPSLTSKQNLNWGVETIYPMADKLFIGTNSGMQIFSITTNPGNPVLQGTFSHARVCDPVIADGNLAYVTLRSGTQCQGFINQLDVVNITNVSAPVLIKSFPLTNPHGLSKKNNTLYICDGAAGLKIMDASSAQDVKVVKTLEMAKTFDVIATQNIAYVSAEDGIHVLDISVEQNPVEKSIIK